MTDQELITRIQEKPPEELSVDEIEEVRDRLRESPALQQALANEINMNQALSEQLGAFRVSVDRILVATGSTAIAPADPVSPWIGWGLGTLITAILTSALTVAITVPSPQDRLKELEDRGIRPLELQPEPPTVDVDPTRPSPSPSDDIPPPPQAAVEVPAEGQQDDAQQTDQQNQNDSTKDGPMAGEDDGPQGAQLFKGFHTARMSEERLKQYLTEVKGQRSRIFHEHGTAAVDGFARLKTFWKPDHVLRVALSHTQAIRFHFWNDKQGVSLVYHPCRVWAAYRTSRAKTNRPQPDDWFLLATDDGRFHRSNRGTFELRCRDGALVLSRGDVRLLTAPCPESPKAIYVEGRTGFAGFEVRRGGNIGPEPQRPVDYFLRTEQPGRLAWKTHLPKGAEFQKVDDGDIELRGKQTKEDAYAFVPLEQAGLHELILEVENPSLGTGVYLGDRAGKPRFCLNYFQDSRAKQNHLRFTHPGDTNTNHHTNQHYPQAFVADRFWVRLVLGHRVLKGWVSEDGRNWARIYEPLRGGDGTCATFGVYCVRDNKPRQIRVKTVALRELEGIHSLVADDVLAQAPGLSMLEHYPDWMRGVLESKPQNVSADAWIRACAIRTVAGAPNAELSKELLESLADEVTQLPIDAQRRLHALDEIALLRDTWDKNQSEEMAEQYRRLGRQLVRERMPQAAGTITRGLIRAPLWTSSDIDLLSAELIRHDMLPPLYDRAWEELYQQADFWRFWNERNDPGQGQSAEQKRITEFVDWAAAWAIHHLPKYADADRVALQQRWRHPFVVKLSKEGFNTLAEFEAALASGAYRDACMIISAAGPRALGLLPEARDPDLFVSLPGAVALAMRDHPQVRETMHNEFGPIGQVRLREAIAHGDGEAVEAATVQFYGTSVAAEAHRWLGDRAFARGDFTRALGQYRRALENATPGLGVTVNARLRLAAAMLGRDRGEPVTGTVDLGETTMDGAAFEKLVAEMRASHAHRAQVKQNRNALAEHQEPAPAPTGFETKKWSRIDGDCGRDGRNSNAIDWYGRQIAVTHTDGLMIVSNRFQVAAYDANSGKRKWSTGLGGEQARTLGWLIEPMQPLVVGSRVYARRLTNKGPEIVAIELDSGKVLWRRRPEQYLASDPVFVQDELLVLSVQPLSTGTLQLELTSFDAETGDVFARRPLIELRDMWKDKVPCRMISVGDRLIGSVGGCVFSCNLLGEVRWLRRQALLPEDVNPDWKDRFADPPLVSGDVAYVTQPGVKALEAIELDNGRLRWRTVLPEMQGALGVADNRVYVRSESGISAVNTEDGEIAWRYDQDDLLSARLVGGKGQLVISANEYVREHVSRPVLIWLDAETGQETARAPLDDLAAKEPRLGPLVQSGDRLLAFYADDGRAEHRDIVQLVAKGDPQRGGLPSVAAVWGNPAADLHRSAEAALPSWTVVSGPANNQTGIQPELHGEKNVLITYARAHSPVQLMRELKVPEAGNCKLRVRVATRGDQPWELRVVAEGKRLLQRKFKESRWEEVQVDLSEFAGQTVRLLVEQSSSKGAYAGWKMLELVRQ